MKAVCQKTLALGVLLGALSACGSVPTITPSVNITSPNDNSTVNLAANNLVSINFTTNFSLKAPGTCGDQDTCGHVYLLIDNTNCNQPQLPYNALVISSPAEADFGRCATKTGMHTILLELRYDNGATVNTLLGNPVTSRVTVTTQ